MLVTSIFSFSYKVSSLLRTNFNIWTTFNYLSAIAFNFDKSKNLLFGKDFKKKNLKYLLDLSSILGLDSPTVLNKSFLPGFCEFESKTTFIWLNNMV